MNYYTLFWSSWRPLLGFGVASIITATQRTRTFTIITPLPESEMAYLEVMTNELNAPQLSELAILYREEYFAHFHAEMDIVHFQRILHYYSTWNVPALRHMSTSNLIPIRFSGCTSLQSLSIGMDYFGNEVQQRRFDAVALAAFLSSCPVLRKVSLRFFWATGLANGRSTDRVDVGSVEELDLYLSECSASPVEYFMDAVRFPRVMSMKFVVACGENFNESNRYPRNIVQAVFSNAVVFPHMKQLEFSTNFGSNIPDHNPHHPHTDSQPPKPRVSSSGSQRSRD